MKNIKKLMQWAGMILVLFMAACTQDDSEATDARDKFVGSWKCTESGAGANGTPYTIIIQKSGSSSIDIYNFGNLDKNEKVTASVSGTALSISTQTIGGSSVTGTGSFQNPKLNLSYTIDTDNFTASCEKQ